ncbi:unnamed protein product [Chrysoparadoxa australica]
MTSYQLLHRNAGQEELLLEDFVTWYRQREPGEELELEMEERVEWETAWSHAANACTEMGEAGGITMKGVGKHLAFKPDQEGEKVLHYLEAIPCATMIQQVLMAFISTAEFSVSQAETRATDLPFVRSALSELEARGEAAARAMRGAEAPKGESGALEECSAFCQQLSSTEEAVARSASLLHKLTSTGLVETIMKQREQGKAEDGVLVDGNSHKLAVRQLLQRRGGYVNVPVGALPLADRRECVLRQTCAIPIGQRQSQGEDMTETEGGNRQRLLVSRMYTCVDKDRGGGLRIGLSLVEHDQ